MRVERPAESILPKPHAEYLSTTGSEVARGRLDTLQDLAREELVKSMNEGTDWYRLQDRQKRREVTVKDSSMQTVTTGLAQGCKLQENSMNTEGVDHRRWDPQPHLPESSCGE